MKRLLMGFAACALMMTSCAKQEITETVSDGQDQLCFSPGIGKQSSRAAELTNTSLQDAASTEVTGVALKTYQETEIAGTFKDWFADNLWYEKANLGWRIKSTRFRNTAVTKYITYFPKTDKLEEVEDADDNTKTTFETADFVTKFPQFTYTIDVNSAMQEDLIAGITEVEANKTDIILAMRHILSQVNFGTVGYSGANIAIRNIKIVGLFNSALYEYGAANAYPIGAWSDEKTDGVTGRTATYDYYDYSNTTATNNPQPVVPADATRGEIYIFGDGGNAGPGRVATTWYPNKDSGDWENAPATGSTGLKNSLILLPQTFTGELGAKVTFEYQITDVDGAYMAGGINDVWASGEFKLDFATGITGTDYKAMWAQNYRYVYLIDFTDFIDGNALSFSVDVETYPWENHDGGTGDIEIKVAGQPTQANMNHTNFIGGDVWYIATQSETAPTAKKWAQVIRNEDWNFGAYNFTNIESTQTFVLNFANVIFNTSDKPSTGTPTTITLTLPTGYTADKGAGIGMSGDSPIYTISEGNRTANAIITITNNNLEYSTPGTLNTAIAAVNQTGKELIYKGKDAVNLTTMEPTLITANEQMTVKFSSGIVPTVGASQSGIWAWSAVNRTATWTHN